MVRGLYVRDREARIQFAQENGVLATAAPGCLIRLHRMLKRESGVIFTITVCLGEGQIVKGFTRRFYPVTVPR